MGKRPKPLSLLTPFNQKGSFSVTVLTPQWTPLLRNGSQGQEATVSPRGEAAGLPPSLTRGKTLCGLLRPGVSAPPAGRGGVLRV